MLRVMRETSPKIEQRRTSVTAIARAWRTWITLKREQNAAATKLQACWRMEIGKKEATVLRLDYILTR